MKSYKETAAQCAHGEASFDDLFHRYSPRIYAFALHVCHSADIAEDLTQEIFIKFWESSQRTEINSSEHFLYTIARRTTIDYLRKSIAYDLLQPLPDDEEASGFTAPADTDEDEQLSKREMERRLSLIEQMVEQMPPRRRTIFKMRWEKGLGVQEIASTLGLSLSTIHIQLRKAMDFLKKNAEISTIELLLIMAFWKG